MIKLCLWLERLDLDPQRITLAIMNLRRMGKGVSFSNALYYQTFK